MYPKCGLPICRWRIRVVAHKLVVFLQFVMDCGGARCRCERNALANVRVGLSAWWMRRKSTRWESAVTLLSVRRMNSSRCLLWASKCTGWLRYWSLGLGQSSGIVAMVPNERRYGGGCLVGVHFCAGVMRKEVRRVIVLKNHVCHGIVPEGGW